MADRGQGVEHRAHRGGAFAFEVPGDVLRDQRLRGACRDTGDGADLLGEGGRPGNDALGRRGGGLAQIERLRDGFCIVRRRILGPKPADQRSEDLG